MEPQYQTVEQMHERLLAMIRIRRDTGFRTAVANTLLEPKNPFDAARRRRPKTAVAVAAFLTVFMLAVFLYFTFLSGK